MALIWACLLLASAGTVFGTSCDCSYKFYHGCKIIKPAPEGFACQCIYVGWWTCEGIPRKCEDKDEWCPAGDYSHEACMKGGNIADQKCLNDCWGYTNCDGNENIGDCGREDCREGQ